MANVLIKHTVEDYDAWKPHFDDHGDTREEFGEQGYRLFRVAEDPNEIVVLLEWASVDTARSFLEDSDLHEVMEEAGVVGEPEVYFLDEIETKASGRPAE